MPPEVSTWQASQNTEEFIVTRLPGVDVFRIFDSLNLDSQMERLNSLGCRNQKQQFVTIGTSMFRSKAKYNVQYCS